MLSFTLIVLACYMMSNSIYSIGLQRLKPVHTAYGAICMPIRKLLMHWHHSSTSQLCIYGDGPELALGTRRKWPRPRRDRDVDSFSREETETRRCYVSRPRPQDRDHNPAIHCNGIMPENTMYCRLM